MNSTEIIAMLAITSRITLASSRITRQTDDDAIAEQIAEMAEAHSALIDLMAELRPNVILALAHRLNTPHLLRHVKAIDIHRPVGGPRSPS